MVTLELAESMTVHVRVNSVYTSSWAQVRKQHMQEDLAKLDELAGQVSECMKCVREPKQPGSVQAVMATYKLNILQWLWASKVHCNVSQCPPVHFLSGYTVYF